MASARQSGTAGSAKTTLRSVEREVKKKIRVPILKESNVGSYMAIDEKTIDGVCYTIISNRETSKIALMADTLRTPELRQVLSKFPVKTKMKVLSVTRDMAPNYDWLARTTFPNAY